MKLIKYGTINSTQTISLDITLDPTKYILTLDCDTTVWTTYSESGGTRYMGGGAGAYVSSKSSTNVTITISHNVNCSYQIIQIED